MISKSKLAPLPSRTNWVRLCVSTLVLLLHGCASSGLQVIDGTALRATGCEKVDLRALPAPEDLEQKNICFTGVFYTDSEYFLILPGESSTPEIWDIAVFLPWAKGKERAQLESARGSQIDVVGDLQYSSLCWGKQKIATNEEVICAPVARPIFLSKGRVVLQR